MLGMLSKLLNHDTIRTCVECRDWQEAVRIGAHLLVAKNSLEERYVETIIDNHQKFGPYMVIAPGIVLAHARPEDGVLQLSMSLITLQHPLMFGNFTNDPVKIVITLGAKDADSHLEALTQLMELLSNEKDMDKIMRSTRQREVIEIIRQYP